VILDSAAILTRTEYWTRPMSAIKVLRRDALMNVNGGNDPGLSTIGCGDLIGAGLVVVRWSLSEAWICDREYNCRVDILCRYPSAVVELVCGSVIVTYCVP
jgi:hypothetical protein